MREFRNLTASPAAGSDASDFSVSCVVPCYNCADTIARCVRSAQTQTQPVTEIILVDDCSDDETLARINALAADDSRIIVLSTPSNGGPSRARNAGWERASGAFIAFLDADDSWHPQKIELQLPLFQLWPHLAIVGHLAAVQGEPVIDARHVIIGSDLSAITRQISRASVLSRNPWSTPTVMLRRDLPFRFEEDQREAEDYLLWAQILLSGALGVRLELPLATLYKARFGAGGLSGNLWQMEKGELRSIRKLWQQELIGTSQLCFLSIFSIVKYLRRAFGLRQNK